MVAEVLSSLAASGDLRLARGRRAARHRVGLIWGWRGWFYWVALALLVAYVAVVVTVLRGAHFLIRGDDSTLVLHRFLAGPVEVRTADITSIATRTGLHQVAGPGIRPWVHPFVLTEIGLAGGAEIRSSRQSHGAELLDRLEEARPDLDVATLPDVWYVQIRKARYELGLDTVRMRRRDWEVAAVGLAAITLIVLAATASGLGIAHGRPTGVAPVAVGDPGAQIRSLAEAHPPRRSGSSAHHDEYSCQPGPLPGNAQPWDGDLWRYRIVARTFEDEAAPADVENAVTRWRALGLTGDPVPDGDVLTWSSRLGDLELIMWVRRPAADAPPAGSGIGVVLESACQSGTPDESTLQAATEVVDFIATG